VIPSSEYALWHGFEPMGSFLRETMSAEQLLVEGSGIRVRDQGGRWYIDARSALWNMTFGYGHPAVVAAIQRQLGQLSFGTLLSYEHPPAITVEFANALAARLPDGLRHIRLGTTGSQMNEAAILLSRFFRQVTGEPDRNAVISFEGSYHGTGPAASLLSGILSYAHDWCGPKLPEVYNVPADGEWSAAVSDKVAALGAGRVTAVVIEPLTGSSGIIPAPADLARLAGFCREQGIHLIADEVSTGYGRVGHMSRLLQLGITPDVLVLSKGITAGYVPGGALAVHDDIFGPLAEPESGQGFSHGSTADGHPLAAAAGLAVLKVLYEDGLIDTVQAKGKVLQEALAQVHQEYLPAGAVSGAGLMQRFQLLDADGSPWPWAEVRRLHAACEEAGLLNSMGMGCMWFLPPLITTDQECEEIAGRFADALAAVRKSGSSFVRP
jgi:adenosylmethionine-8-amino-7-oxononanoate aminotransferase